MLKRASARFFFVQRNKRMKITQLKVVQISDCHLSADRARSYRGLNADRELAGLLPAIRRWHPDLILLTGDVAEDASPAAYGRVSAALSSLGAPVVALPGNHDDAALMSRYFPMGPWNGPLFRNASGWQLVLLNSAPPGKISGVVDDRQLEQLSAGLKRSVAKNLLVALHHQPVPVGSPWIDKYALEQPERLLALLGEDSRVRCVTWGHVHQAFESQHAGMRMLSCPSTVANSLPGREKFTADAAGPACRWFVMEADGEFETGLLRAGDA